MSSRSIDKPKFWSIDWYKEQKAKGLTDSLIADQLCISLSVFYGWKRQIGIPKFAHTFSNAKGREKAEKANNFSDKTALSAFKKSFSK